MYVNIETVTETLCLAFHLVLVRKVSLFIKNYVCIMHSLSGFTVIYV